MFYLVKTPWWLKKLYRDCEWDLPVKGQNVYLTFDDGPDPEVTTFVLDELKRNNIKATFFCIGKNVVQYPEVYARILKEGHAVGNHTNNHVKGSKVSSADYMEEVKCAQKYIDSKLFRPPYGRITKFQRRLIGENGMGYKIIMWNILSGDFDVNLSKEEVLLNVIRNMYPGAVVVFHDSQKAKEKIFDVLPKLLNFLKGAGYSFDKILDDREEKKKGTA
jgi:peptidoglycan/xylan/chitin deacetylase (PgdA/CDA1 family)